MIEIGVDLFTVKRFVTIICAVLLMCGLTVWPTSFASAAPSNADINAASRKLKDMESQMATAQKNYRAASNKLAQARTDAANSRAELKKLNASIEAHRQSLNTQADYLYRTGNASFLEALLSSKSFDEVFSKITMLNLVSDSNAKTLNSLRLDQRRRASVQNGLDQQLKTQETQTASLARQSQQAMQALASQQSYVNGLSAAQQAALEAAQIAANNRAVAHSKPESNNNPPASGGGGGGGGNYTGTGQTFTGLATWYGVGKGTASGEPFDPNAMTAAHKTLPFGTLVRVTYKGRSVVVRINDRGPYGAGRVIDLTRAAADVIGLRSAGVGYVTCEIVN